MKLNWKFFLLKSTFDYETKTKKKINIILVRSINNWSRIIIIIKQVIFMPINNNASSSSSLLLLFCSLENNNNNDNNILKWIEIFQFFSFSLFLHSTSTRLWSNIFLFCFVFFSSFIEALLSFTGDDDDNRMVNQWMTTFGDFSYP